MWGWILLACLIAYATKAIGYLIPRHLLDTPGFTRIAGTLTVGLLASLIVMNTLASGQEVRFDARLAALAAAIIACALRAPYLVIVIAGATAAALARLAGLS